MGNLSDHETRLALSIHSFNIGAMITTFSKYSNLFSDPLNQAIEVIINVSVIGGILLCLYGLGGIRYYCLNPESTEEEYFIEEGAYIIITGILCLILVSLGGILTNLSQFGLGI